MTVAEWIKPIIEQLISAGLASKETIVGCSDDEIAEIETILKLKLPSAYRDYLKAMGKRAGNVLNDCLISYPALVELVPNEVAIKSEHSNFKLPHGAFVFLDADNLFFYFDTSAGNDPPIYRWNEGQAFSEKIAENFRDWLVSQINAEIE